jgi:hypothetical protein
LAKSATFILRIICFWSNIISVPGPHVLAELATPVIAVIATLVIAGLNPAIFFLNF